MKIKFFKDTFISGLIVGLIIPAAFMYLFILAAYKGESSVFEVVNQLYDLGKLAPFLGVSVVPNLIMFFQYIRKEFWKGGRGLIAATLIYGLAVVYVKYML